MQDTDHRKFLKSSAAVATGAFRRSQIATTYSNGLKVIVNGHQTETWRIADAWIDFTVVAATGAKKDYALVWCDEFEGSELDTSKWNYRGLGPRRNAINVKETVSLDGKGHLILTTERVGDKYHTAMIGTQGKFEAKHGYFECRVRLQAPVGHWSAFWLQSPTIGEGGDPKVNGTEIDIYEYFGREKDTLGHNLHWHYGKKNQGHVGAKSEHPNLSDGFHVIGLQWTPEEYVFFVDGKKAWRTTEAISHVEQYVILSLEVGRQAGDIAKAKLPGHLCVDYVRVYQRKKHHERKAF